MRVVILDPYASGHHASYLRWLVQAARREHWSVVVATSKTALTHPLLNTIAADLGDVSTHLVEAGPGMGSSDGRSSKLLFREFAYWRTFKRVVLEVREKTAVDGVILPYVDYCFYALAICGSPFQELPWCGICMRLGVAPGAADARSLLPLKWRLARRILGAPTLSALFVINPSVQDVPPSWLSTTRLSKLRYLPDPAEFESTTDRTGSRAALGILDGDVGILVFGSIDERKGIDALLNSISSEKGLGNYVVILAGKQSGIVQSQLRTAPYSELLSARRLIVIDRFLTEVEQSAVFAAADVVWVGYRNHFYMSGVLVLAGRAGRPVVGTSGGEIGRLIEKYRIGVVANIERPAEVTAALREMLDVRTRSRFSEGAQLAFAGHTVENFGASVMAAFHSPQRVSGQSC